MNQKELRSLEDRCVQECAPRCAAVCPVHVDVRAMVLAVAKGDFQVAARVLGRSARFPGIISRICDRPCEKVCVRGACGGAVAIGALELAAMTRASTETAVRRPLPRKTQRVAVVGAGLSGLAAALDLAGKGYRVVVFEASDRLGGHIRLLGEDILPESVINSDFRVFEGLPIEFRLSVPAPDEIYSGYAETDFQAVYLGMGGNSKSPVGMLTDGNGSITVAEVTRQTSLPGVFAGGSAIAVGDERSPIRSVSDGRRAAISIDRFLQKVSLTASREREGPYETRLFTSTAGVSPSRRVPVSDPLEGYSEEQAREEASRCLQCECMECVKVCEYLAQFKGYPKTYVRRIYNNLSIVMGRRHDNKFINSCSLCGLCKAVCPHDLDMGEVCKAARTMMVDQSKMPPSAHEFALRDMEFSNADKAFLCRNQPGKTSGAHLFFPGCQLSGTAPGHVTRAYSYLLERLDGDVGLMLGCCGAPADWAGRSDMFTRTMEGFRAQWSEMGRPRLITACSSCYSIFKAHLPDMPLVSLWEVMDRHGLPESAVEGPTHRLTIHDPCTSRHEPIIRGSVRNILRSLAVDFSEPPLSGEMTECCGFGGLMSFANRDLADRVVERRIRGFTSVAITYCAVCRDRFAQLGKPTQHILDLVFGLNEAPISRAVGYSERRENRVRLKNALLRDLWSETSMEPEEQERIHLDIPEDVCILMERRMILTEDLEQVIRHAETTGVKLVNAQSGRFLAHWRPAAVTYWVEYSKGPDGFIVHNAYSHRMELSEKAPS